MNNNFKVWKVLNIVCFIFAIVCSIIACGG